MNKYIRDTIRSALAIINGGEILIEKHLMFYILNEDKTYTPCTLNEWMEQFVKVKQRIVRQTNYNEYFISTVWLGLDHQYSPDENASPLVFETMIFHRSNRGVDIYCDRYTTYQEALDGHEKALDWVKHYHGETCL